VKKWDKKHRTLYNNTSVNSSNDVIIINIYESKISVNYMTKTLAELKRVIEWATIMVGDLNTMLFKWIGKTDKRSIRLEQL
jgi:hypothetical protein